MALVKEACSVSGVFQGVIAQREKSQRGGVVLKAADGRIVPALRQSCRRGNVVLRVAADGAVSNTASEKVANALDIDVLIESEAGVSYDELKSKLAQGLWEEADKETRRLLCVLAGDAAVQRQWVYFTEARTIPGKDLLTMDRLWRAYSNDRFGFSVQRRIWKVLSMQWKPFFLKIGWAAGTNSIFKKFPMEFTWDIEAPVGHLPLTNALRGTQLLLNILTHPAFEVFDAEETMPGDNDVPSFSDSESDSPPSASPKTSVAVGFDESFNSADYGF